MFYNKLLSHSISTGSIVSCGNRDGHRFIIMFLFVPYTNVLQHFALPTNKTYISKKMIMQCKVIKAKQQLYKIHKTFPAVFVLINITVSVSKVTNYESEQNRCPCCGNLQSNKCCLFQKMKWTGLFSDQPFLFLLSRLFSRLMSQSGHRLLSS